MVPTIEVVGDLPPRMLKRSSGAGHCDRAVTQTPRGQYQCRVQRRPPRGQDQCRVRRSSTPPCWGCAHTPPAAHNTWGAGRRRAGRRAGIDTTLPGCRQRRRRTVQCQCVIGVRPAPAHTPLPGSLCRFTTTPRCKRRRTLSSIHDTTRHQTDCQRSAAAQRSPAEHRDHRY